VCVCVCVCLCVCVCVCLCVYTSDSLSVAVSRCVWKQMNASVCMSIALHVRVRLIAQTSGSKVGWLVCMRIGWMCSKKQKNKRENERTGRD